MAEVISPVQHTIPMTTEPLHLTTETRLPPPSQSVVIPQPTLAERNRHLNLNTFSPVNQKGHFEFDRVLKNGVVHKRTRKTKQWRSFYLVLRPNLLSIYKSPLEDRLHKQLNLSELSAVAYLKDQKGKRQNVFGLFSPSRNYHFQASSPEEARSWVELIKHEARIDEEEQGVLYHSPTTLEAGVDPRWDHDGHASSSPEPLDTLPRTSTRDGVRIPSAGKPSTHDLEHSGNEQGSCSDFSDAAPAQSSFNQSNFGSLISPKSRKFSPYGPFHSTFEAATQSRPEVLRNTSQNSGFQETEDPERVIWHGYLLCLKSHRGVRQWKRLWAVLRLKNLAFYKNEDEYSAQLIIPLSNIISAVEIDPVSRSKSHCMQIIAEDRSYRFCAPSEEALARWLGALKCQLVKRQERRDGLGRNERTL